MCFHDFISQFMQLSPFLLSQNVSVSLVLEPNHALAMATNASSAIQDTWNLSFFALMLTFQARAGSFMLDRGS